MGVIISLVVAVSLIGYITYRKLTPSLDTMLEKAIQSQDITQVLAWIAKKSESQRPTLYNHAVRALWDRYERKLAVQVTRDLASKHKEARITQYWLKQIQQVEPRLAKEQLGVEFYEAFFMPELAARCGSAG